MKLEDFDYVLPHELIAQAPASERSASRLLHLEAGGALRDLQFRDFVELTAPEDVIVFNDTRVIKARLTGRKATGGQIEVLVERVLSQKEVLAQVRASHAPREGALLILAQDVHATVLARSAGLTHIRFHDCEDVFALLERYGTVPLPPYIDHAAEAHDEQRYQTVYAREPGAVAAPTAGLHFDQSLLDRLRGRGVSLACVTLHVGAGTFQPVRSGDLSEHEMHSEWYCVPQETADAIGLAKERGGRVVAVGTTTLRALESAALSPSTPLPLRSGRTEGDPSTPLALRSGRTETDSSTPLSVALQATTGETKLFILPGYRFRVVDRLITNFHLPKSTLLMLVSAFAGMNPIRRAYEHAIRERYRFFSYGDAMLMDRAPEPPVATS